MGRSCPLAPFLLWLLLGSPFAHSAIVIGHTGPQTGAFAATGAQLVAGLRTAFAEANAAGFLPQNLTLRAMDDAADPERARRNIDALLNAGDVLLLAGAYGDRTAALSGPVATAAGLPYVGGYTGAPATREPF